VRHIVSGIGVVASTNGWYCASYKDYNAMLAHARSLPGLYEGVSNVILNSLGVLSIAGPTALIGGVAAVGVVASARALQYAVGMRPFLTDAEWWKLAYYSFVFAGIGSTLIAYSSILGAGYATGNGFIEQGKIVLNSIYCIPLLHSIDDVVVFATLCNINSISTIGFIGSYLERKMVSHMHVEDPEVAEVSTQDDSIISRILDGVALGVALAVKVRCSLYRYLLSCVR
jgi:hypothetical protein